MDNVWQPTDSGYVNSAIRAALAKQPLCGIGAKVEIAGNVMTIKTKTIFFSDAGDTYNIAVYITEDNCYAVQASSSEVYHFGVLRGSANGAYGTQLSTGPVRKWDKKEQTFTFTIPTVSPAINPSNLHAVVVIWKVDANGQPIEVINSNRF